MDDITKDCVLGIQFLCAVGYSLKLKAEEKLCVTSNVFFKKLYVYTLYRVF